jgi:hypothetical protein
MLYTVVKRTLTYSRATGHVSTETILAAGVTRPECDTLMRRNYGAVGQEHRPGDEARIGVTRTYVNGVLQVPVHEDETDCPEPLLCRAHAGCFA